MGGGVINQTMWRMRTAPTLALYALFIQCALQVVVETWGNRSWARAFMIPQCVRHKKIVKLVERFVLDDEGPRRAAKR